MEFDFPISEALDRALARYDGLVNGREAPRTLPLPPADYELLAGWISERSASRETLPLIGIDPATNIHGPLLFGAIIYPQPEGDPMADFSDFAPALTRIEKGINALTQKFASEAAPVRDIGTSLLQGRRAETYTDALVNAQVGLDADGFPHRYSGTHAGSTEDWAEHLKNNALAWPKPRNASGVGSPDYSDWKDPYLALYLLSQSQGLKTPRETKELGFGATNQDEIIKNNGWKTTTTEEWFAKIRSTNGQGGASGDGA